MRLRAMHSINLLLRVSSRSATLSTVENNKDSYKRIVLFIAQRHQSEEKNSTRARAHTNKQTNKHTHTHTHTHQHIHTNTKTS